MPFVAIMSSDFGISRITCLNNPLNSRAAKSYRCPRKWQPFRSLPQSTPRFPSLTWKVKNNFRTVKTNCPSIITSPTESDGRLCFSELSGLFCAERKLSTGHNSVVSYYAVVCAAMKFFAVFLVAMLVIAATNMQVDAGSCSRRKNYARLIFHLLKS